MANFFSGQTPYYAAFKEMVRDFKNWSIERIVTYFQEQLAIKEMKINQMNLVNKAQREELDSLNMENAYMRAIIRAHEIKAPYIHSS